MKSFLAIVLGDDENAYECAREVYSVSGERPILISPGRCDALQSSSLFKLTVIPDLEQSSVFKSTLLAVIKRLAESVENIAVIPCTSRLAYLLSEYESWLSSSLCLRIITLDKLIELQSVSSFFKLCKSHSVPHIKSKDLSLSELVCKKNEIEFPITVSIDSAISDKRSVRNEEELCVLISDIAISGYSGNLSLTEQVDEDRYEHLIVNAYCDARSKVRVVGAMRPILKYSQKRSVGEHAVLESVSEVEICNSVADLLEKIGCIGFVSTSVAYSKDRKECMMLELKCRYFSYFGREFILCMYKDAVLGAPFEGREYVKEGFVWRSEAAFVIKREMKRRGISGFERLNALPQRKALALGGDISAARALVLIRELFNKCSMQI